jgi:hypothetical protein
MPGHRPFGRLVTRYLWRPRNDASSRTSPCAVINVRVMSGLKLYPDLPPCVVTRAAEIAAEGGADRRSAKNADAPMNQSREAHHSARPHHSPRGGLTSSDPASRQRGGTRVAGVWTRVGTSVPTSVGSRALAMAVLGWDRQGCGACQRSSTRRRRVPLPATERGRRPSAGRGPGQARSRQASELAGWVVPPLAAA